MDPVQLVLGYVAGIASAVVAYLVAERRRVPAPIVEGPTPEQRLRRVDATEAYLTAMVGWLFARAVGNVEPSAQRDPNLAGVPFGQVDVRLLRHDTALEFASLCRWLWGDGVGSTGGPSGSDDSNPRARVVAEEAIARERAFRDHLRADLERQRRLIEDGRPAEYLAPEAAAILDQVIDEVMRYREETAGYPALASTHRN